MATTITRAVESTLSSVAAWLHGSPEGQAIVRQSQATQERDRLALRQHLAEQRAALVARHFEAQRNHEKNRKPLADDVHRLESELVHARDQLRSVDGVAQGKTFELSSQIDKVNERLLASASPQLAAFVTELRDLRDASYRQRDAVTEKAIDGKGHLKWQNSASIEARVEAIDAAIVACGETGPLVFEPLDEPALAARLDNMRASIPEIEPRPARYSVAGGGAA
ncbi:MAG: hypothetical protein A3H95_16830 [Acidobacteria bacterium RIFCSPLOWO2_02_FULL_64_15]|nr:MAG: hypothetical protein A3H95_16830 [Acidobacteria bacterium RIFCSPLOWO2_02_FULL_64_15]